MSKNYSYSFFVPEGWIIKDKIYNPKVDAKIVDGKGNSFIVSVEPTPVDIGNKSIKQFYSGISDAEVEAGYSTIYDNCKLIKRMIYNLDGKEFYLIQLSNPLTQNERLVHKLFMINYKSKLYTIDATSLNSMLIDSAPFFSMMLDSFKLN